MDKEPKNWEEEDLEHFKEKDQEIWEDIHENGKMRMKKASIKIIVGRMMMMNNNSKKIGKKKSKRIGKW